MPGSRPPRPSLRRELLTGLSLLAAAALSVAVLAALMAEGAEPDITALALSILIAADVIVVVLFGRFLVDRLIFRPMHALGSAARELAAGNLQYRAPPALTREFTEFADQFNEMTDRLLDAQSQLVQAEKLAGIGRLAAGVAHEVGNPLSAVGTYLEVLRKRGGDPEILAAIVRETERIDRIIRGLLEYARPHDEEAEPVDLGAVVEGAVELLRQQGALGAATVRVQVDPAAPRALGKTHAFEQIAVNLLLNAVDAAPGGAISVGVESCPLDPAVAERFRRSDPGPVLRPSRPSRRPWRTEIMPGSSGVLLYVSDSGPGVPDQDRNRVFDPFFTTKPPGSGTGLGLAIVHRTVYEAGGVVWVDQAREGGAAFKVFLPAAGPA